MQTKIIKSEFEIQKYISLLEKEKIEKKSWFCKKDSNKSISTEETNMISNKKLGVEELKLDFQIPDFLNDKRKIIISNRNISPLIPKWYKNLKNSDFSNFNYEDNFDCFNFDNEGNFDNFDCLYFDNDENLFE